MLLTEGGAFYVGLAYERSNPSPANPGQLLPPGRRSRAGAAARLAVTESAAGAATTGAGGPGSRWPVSVVLQSLVEPAGQRPFAPALLPPAYCKIPLAALGSTEAAHAAWDIMLTAEPRHVCLGLGVQDEPQPAADQRVVVG